MTDPVQTPDLWPESPWADDEASAQQPAVSGPNAYRAVLRPSLILLLASTILLFAAAVASSNAPLNTPAARISLLVHRTSMLAMLVSFVGILVAYRLPIVVAALKSRLRDRITDDARPRVLTPDLQLLLMASALSIAWVWGAAYSGHALFQQLTHWGLLGLTGLLANMAILHKGCVRSFAVGTLVTLLLAMFAWRSFFAAFILMDGPYGRQTIDDPLFATLVSEVTLAVLSGLLCAFYYNLLLLARGRADEPPTTPA